MSAAIAPALILRQGPEKFRGSGRDGPTPAVALVSPGSSTLRGQKFGICVGRHRSMSNAQ